jgi:hypothetical protein
MNSVPLFTIMIKKTVQKTIAKLIIVTAMLLWLFERTTGTLSEATGKFLYGKHNIQAVDDYIMDRSYSFNADIHLSLSLIVLFILGMVLYIKSLKQTGTEQPE